MSSSNSPYSLPVYTNQVNMNTRSGTTIVLATFDTPFAMGSSKVLEKQRLAMFLGILSIGKVQHRCFKWLKCKDRFGGYKFHDHNKRL